MKKHVLAPPPEVQPANVRSSNRPAISVRQMSRTYGSFTAIDSISFEVPTGSVFGLLGTNGAGKTSALEVIEGLAEPASGSAEVLGMNPVTNRARLRTMIGIMMQEGGFPHELTVTETARMWHGTLTAPLSVNAALELVDLRGRADRPVKALSGGERRRLDLALAVMGRPAVLFLDEPTTGLDPESRRSAWNLIAALREAGTTMVLTTHYMDEAEQLCDTLAIMHEGRIVEHGSITEILSGNPSTISFDLAIESGVLKDTVPELPAVTGTITTAPPAAGGAGTSVSVSTDQLQRDLHAILGWAAEHSIELTGVRAQEADLEQVFLAIAHDRSAAPPAVASA